MVGGHHGDDLALDHRLGLALDAGELDGEGLEPAERLGRLGELELARLGGAHGVGVERRNGGDGARDQVGGHWSDSFGGNGGAAGKGAASALTSRG